MKNILFLILLLFLPGYLIIRAARGGVPPSRSLCRRAWLQAVVTSIVAASWAGLVLLEFGIFSPPALLVVLVGFSAALYLIFHPPLRGGTATGTSRASSIWPLAIILCAFALLCLCSGSSEYVFGGWDSGEYVAMGALVAEKGSIVYRDDFFASLPAKVRPFFTQGGRRYMGFNLPDPNASIVVPKFMPLYPLWLAVSMTVGGIRLALSLNVLLSLISITLCYQIAFRLGGRGAGAIASALLASSALEIWFARNQCAEPLAQVFFLGAVYFWILWRQGSGRAAAPLSAACLGMMFLAKVDCVVVLPCVVLALLSVRRRRGTFLFLLVSLLALLQLAAHFFWWSRPYARAILNNLAGAPGLGAVFVAAVVLYVLIAIACVKRGRGSPVWTGLRSRIAVGAALLAAALALYFIRPALGASPERANLVEFSWLTGEGLFWWGLAAFLWVWVRGIRDEESLLWFSALGVTALFSLTLAGEHHLYPWSARRFIPVTLPALALFSGCLAAELYPSLRRGARIAFIAALAVLAVTPMVRYPYLVTGRDYRGGIDAVRRLCAATRGYDIVICEQVRLAVPLDFICGRNVLLFRGAEQTVRRCEEVEKVIRGWLDEGRRVAYVTSGPAVHGKSVAFQKRAELPLRTSIVPLVRHGMAPGEAAVTSFLKVFEALSPNDYIPADGEVFDIHYSCFGIEEGFFQPRRIDRRGGVGRWTAPRASLIIPWFADGSARELVLTLSTGPRGGAEVPVGVYVDGVIIAAISARGPLKDYRITVPEGTARGRDRVRLGLETPPWDPAEAGLSGYPSPLGIFLDKITINRKTAD